MFVIYVLIAVFIGLLVYLGWQASIEPPAYETMFEMAPVEDECPPSPGQNPSRFWELEGALNFRDLGGYQTRDGRCLAYGRVYRSGSLDRLTDADLAQLEAAGVRMVCDLRSYAEARGQPDRLPSGASYQHLPVYGRDPIGRWRAIFQRHRLDQIFQRLYSKTIIDQGAAVTGGLLRLVADPDNLPLVFHCTRGKDRTGVAAALILHICGVPRQTIVADYTLTNNSNNQFIANIQAAFASVPKMPGFSIEQFYPLLSARPELIERALAHIERTYGSLDDYLLGPVGLTVMELEAIRRNLLE